MSANGLRELTKANREAVLNVFTNYKIQIDSNKSIKDLYSILKSQLGVDPIKIDQLENNLSKVIREAGELSSRDLPIVEEKRTLLADRKLWPMLRVSFANHPKFPIPTIDDNKTIRELLDPIHKNVKILISQNKENFEILKTANRLDRNWLEWPVSLWKDVDDTVIEKWNKLFSSLPERYKKDFEKEISSNTTVLEAENILSDLLQKAVTSSPRRFSQYRFIWSKAADTI